MRKLDTAQSNLTATLDHIRLVVSCGSCVAGVRAALDAGDYDALAGHIATYQDLMETAGGSGGDGALERQLERGGDAGAVVAAARDKLLTVTRQHVREALAAQDAAAALRWLRLYKPLQLPDEGMAATLQFITRHATLCSRLGATELLVPRFCLSVAHVARSAPLCCIWHQPCHGEQT